MVAFSILCQLRLDPPPPPPPPTPAGVFNLFCNWTPLQVFVSPDSRGLLFLLLFFISSVTFRSLLVSPVLLTPHQPRSLSLNLFPFTVVYFAFHAVCNPAPPPPTSPATHHSHPQPKQSLVVQLIVWTLAVIFILLEAAMYVLLVFDLSVPPRSSSAMPWLLCIAHLVIVLTLILCYSFLGSGMMLCTHRPYLQTLSVWA